MSFLSPRRREFAKRQLEVDAEARAVHEEAIALGVRNAYRQGLADGVKLTLDQLEDSKDAPAPEGAYTGPVPDELASWLRRARNNYRKVEHGEL